MLDIFAGHSQPFICDMPLTFVAHFIQTHLGQSCRREYYIEIALAGGAGLAKYKHQKTAKAIIMCDACQENNPLISLFLRLGDENGELMSSSVSL